LKDYPAIDVRTSDPDLLLAIVDDFGPIAVEAAEFSGTVRLFFSTPGDRDAAQHILADRFESTPVEVSDEDWARRSQENLTPVTVGRVTVFPGPEAPSPPASAPSDTDGASARLAEAAEPRRRQPVAPELSVVIVPSMGFGTGHHATTRLCLAALQTLDLTNQVVLDVGTGSGVLALAADRLGAARVLGIDYDADAVQSANENLPLNPSVTHVTFQVLDLAAGALPVADVLTANLTGAVLVRAAVALLAALRSGGTLILSGVLAHERDEVCRAFSAAAVVWERDEDGWVGLVMKKR
jgi:ribosomal protein L11 methylase PrmA